MDMKTFSQAEPDSCECLRQWQALGCMLFQGGPGFVFYLDEAFSRWYKTLNPYGND